MTTVTFVHPDGRKQHIAADAGETVMQAATRNDINGILAECGGNAMCATCHVYVDVAWFARLAAMADDEDALLDGTAAERRAQSRLSCQINLSAGLDGLILHLPDRQT